ncbi:nickel pincer cofactor biosynthesis protein LarC [Propionispora hippei]|uniref:Pyridinium-3,5-bisthiocarboxylic acid mononucleotide nickel insertion protein n=1 Tax=Propionispora hippei DSM 15287 TaxID=1123003 RepID=A0A1M6IGQ3_9FIRM|nr:nickel pincer cofactor biosynthesis protein LarC [Propionispora hippei]SHJ33623.1 hypothetical protein SAMN02745170_02309 [Propionispora hippei DSM 15287]
MRILYYDCFCGISGDMNLAALLDLGVDEAYVRQELAKLELGGEYVLAVDRAMKQGITGTQVKVHLTAEPETDETGDRHSHNQGHGDHHRHHDHHHHHPGSDQHEHGHEHEHHHHEQEEHAHHHHVLSAVAGEASRPHVHRNLYDIEQIINNSRLPERVKALSCRMFRKIAAAEAKVHGKTVEEVHFHEVGATDSIVDMVGAAIALDYLQVDKILASTVQVGGGFVKCAHGVMPVPAPATAELLQGIPVKSGLVPFETTTPTGAAVLAANVDQFTDEMNFVIEKTGYGIGHRDMNIPNVLRVYLGRDDSRSAVKTGQWIWETNLDDMSPEQYGYVEERLFAAGALDVWKSPIVMKKGRLATTLSVLAEAASEQAVLDLLLQETTALGVRKYQVEKIMLDREFVTLDTCYGQISVKKAYYGGKLVKYKPEYEDCRRCAAAHDVPLALVYREVAKLMEEKGYVGK